MWGETRRKMLTRCELLVQIEADGETRSLGDAAATAWWRTPATVGEEKRSATEMEEIGRAHV